MPTITKTGKRKMMYQHQMWVNFTLLERLMIEYYADAFNCDDSAVLRGMLRKHAEKDRAFDPKAFVRVAESVLVPREEDKDVRKAMRQELAEYKKQFTDEE